MAEFKRNDAYSDPEDVTGTARSLGQILINMGIKVGAPKRGNRIAISGPDDVNIETTLRMLDVPLVLVVLPIKNTPLYNRIKYICDVKLGVHTICVVGSEFAKADPQYLANVALKINLKLGGTNQAVDDQDLGIIHENKTMVVGIDVTHPSPGSASNAPSVAGMVASVDKRLGQWPAILCIQESRKEMVSDLDTMLRSRLLLWQSQGDHVAFPENLLIYRDGVSEGQYATVVDEELPLLRDACRELYPAPDTKKNLPRITIIIVGKRHHTRFYPTRTIDADHSYNPRNGTVVDRGVTETRNWDFFLQAHSAIKGTARPAHYYIVHDEIFARRGVPRLPGPKFRNAADVLEDLTHKMCYLYGPATKAVSICPPAYYADILCDRGRAYLGRLFDGATPSGGTPAPSDAGDGGANQDARAEEVLIHPRLRDSMFYI